MIHENQHQYIYQIRLLINNFNIKIYDPMVMFIQNKEDIENQMKISQIDDDEIEKNLNRVIICDDVYKAIEKSNLLVICTEWDEFINLDWNKIYHKMENNSWVYDGRNILDRDKLEKIGFKTFFIGQ